MNILRALISLGLFGGLGWAVWTGQFAHSGSGSSKTRAVTGLIDNATTRFGIESTAIGLVTLGVGLATIFLIMHRRDNGREWD